LDAEVQICAFLGRRTKKKRRREGEQEEEREVGRGNVRRLVEKAQPSRERGKE